MAQPSSPPDIPPPFYQRIRTLISHSKPKATQWTAKLATLADDCDPEKPDQGVPISLRLEGPYFTPADPYRYNTTICLVAGSGVSGALAIGAAFNATHAAVSSSSSAPGTSRTWSHCLVFWSVKSGSEIELPFLEPMAPGLEVRKFLTGGGRERVDLEKEVLHASGGGRTWVYISGPKQYITNAKAVCQNVRRSGVNLDFYAASWDP